MGMTAREIGAILAGCSLMILVASIDNWFTFGVKRLMKVTFVEEYNMRIIATCMPIGTLVGTVIFGLSCELTGRKITLLATTVTYVTSIVIFHLAKSVAVVSIGQVIAGLSVGGVLVALPIYIGETSEESCRGLLITLMGIFYYIGSIVFRMIGAYAAYTAYTAASITFAVCFAVLFLFVARESPFYYTKRHKTHLDESEEVDKLTQIELKYVQESKTPNYLPTGWIKSILIMLLLTVLYNLSGVYLVHYLVFYIYEYFKNEDVDLQIDTILIISFLLQLLGCIICALLIDRLGRKFCLMASMIGLALFLAPVAIFSAVTEHYNYVVPIPALNITFVIAHLVLLNVGLAPVQHIFLGELFSLKVKTAAVAVFVSMQRVSGFFMQFYLYPEFVQALGSSTVSLFLFMGSMIVGSVAVYFVLIETKQKSLEEIQVALRK
ncbi:unnamed protein product [Phyllotreta striolata]|uniref:Major facilitator superfamily (MFS) profile domain-containing protein n=1 Tax=Phyllotreta striolata TaxID=444603 RepID=A0A9N9XKD9_PHYSR|nr:unnamed protein product [Phyllotreta striolata]